MVRSSRYLGQQATNSADASLTATRAATLSVDSSNRCTAPEQATAKCAKTANTCTKVAALTETRALRLGTAWRTAKENSGNVASQPQRLPPPWLHNAPESVSKAGPPHHASAAKIATAASTLYPRLTVLVHAPHARTGSFFWMAIVWPQVLALRQDEQRLAKESLGVLAATLDRRINVFKVLTTATGVVQLGRTASVHRAQCARTARSCTADFV